MADFDAGSIEGRLDLNTDPFMEGIRKARAEAEDFADEDYTATVTTHYTTDGTAPEDTQTDESGSKIPIGADTSEFERKKAEVEAEVKALGNEKATPEVDLDTRKSTSSVGRLRSALGGFIADTRTADTSVHNFLARFNRGVEDTAGFYAANGNPGVPGSGHGLAMLVGLAASLAPAFAPAVPAAALFGSAWVAGAAQGAIALGSFMAVAKADFKDLQDATKAGIDLTGPAGEAQKALGALGAAWAKLKKDTAGPVFGSMTKAFTMLSGILPKLEPLVTATAHGVSAFLTPLSKFTMSPAFTQFIDMIAKNAVPDLRLLGHTVTNVLSGVMNLFEGLDPITQLLVKGVEQVSEKFAAWSKSMKNGGFDELFDTVKKSGPPMLHMLDEIWKGLESISQGLGPLVGPATKFLTSLGKGLQDIHLGPLAKGIGAAIAALAPFVQVIGQLVNVLLPPLGILLGEISQDFLGPLGKSLAHVLVPAFERFGDSLQQLAPYLGKIAASFADLVNPTGINAFVALIDALGPALVDLAPDLSALVIALESVVDDGLEAITPAIGPVIKVLSEFAKVVSQALVPILSNKAIVDTILAIAAATKIWAVAMGILDAVMDANPIGIVIVAVAALVVGLVAAYQHSSKFRAVVDALGGVMKQVGAYLKDEFVVAWRLLGDVLDFVHDHFKLVMVLLGPLGLSILTVVEIIKHWSTIWNALVTAFDFVHDHIKIFMALLGPLGLSLLAVIEIVKHWGDITGAVKDAWSDVIDFFSGIPGAIEGWFSDAGSWLMAAGSAIFHGLEHGLESVWKGEVSAWSAVGSKVKGWFDGAGDWLVDAGSAVFHGLAHGLTTVWKGEVSVWSTVGSKIKGWFDGAASWLVDAGTAVFNGLFDGIQSAWHIGQAVWTNIASRVRGWFDGAATWLSSIGEHIMEGLFNGISGFWDSHIGPLLDKISSLKDKIAGVFQVLSPSRVFMKIGGYLAEGFFNGFHGLWDLLVPHAVAKAAGLTDQIQGALANVGNLAMKASLDVSQTSTSAQIGTLASSVDALAANHADQTATLKTTMDDLLKAVKEQNNGLLDALSGAYTAAGNQQLTRLITSLRQNR